MLNNIQRVDARDCQFFDVTRGYISIVNNLNLPKPQPAPTLAHVPFLVHKLADPREGDLVRVSAAQHLLYLAQTAEGCATIVSTVAKANAVPQLVNYLYYMGALSQHLVRLLAYLLPYSEVQYVALKTQVIPLLVARLSSEDIMTQIDAACALAAITSTEEGKHGAVNAGAMIPLVRVLCHSSQNMRKMAVRAVRNMTLVDLGRRTAYMANAIQPLVALLHPHPPDVQVHYDAVKALACIGALDKKVRREMKEHGAFQKLKVFQNSPQELRDVAETLRDDLRSS